jgi:transcriptional regulator with XRE-family HTH domain
VDSQDAQFFKVMGARIARARKALNLTQQQLADGLGIVQQTVAHYEVGRIRVPSTMLPKLAETLGITVDELLGLDEKPRSKSRPGPTPKLQQQFEQIHQLPKSQQRFVIRMLDTVIAQAGQEARHA